jgi:hypothetical protein
MSRTTVKAFGKAPEGIATGQCLCGEVQVEIIIPAFWAWHDHSWASRQAHGAAYATYVGCWRSRFRVAKGERQLTVSKRRRPATHAHSAPAAALPLCICGGDHRRW